MEDTGSNNENVIELQIDSDTSCKIHLFGATLISWISNGEEFIFLSSSAKFDNKSAIRGGIPIVFPNFGPWNLGPQHGFARITQWKLEQGPAKVAENANDVFAVFSLEDSDATRAMWNNKFKLKYTVTLKEGSLETSLDIENRGGDAFDFTCLLHTYFRVPDITKAGVKGLHGYTFVDKIQGSEVAVESRELVTIDQTVDRVYERTGDEHQITGVTGGHVIRMQKVHFPDTVVWNPWDKALNMADLGKEYVNMLCVEVGHVSSPVHLPSGHHFVASQTLTVVD